MTITYPGGRRVAAILLSRSSDTLRVAVQDDDDARVFTCVNGTWVSEDCEGVSIQFEWERPARPVPTLEDCICSKELAEELLTRLVNPEVDALQEMLSALAAETGAAMAPATSKLLN